MTDSDNPTLGGLARVLGHQVPSYDSASLIGIASDHRKVNPGYAFFAMPGTKVDGAEFIAGAVAKGATMIVGAGERPAKLDLTTLYLKVADMRRALSIGAAYAFPRQPRTVVAITGTAGKTSVAEFTRQIFSQLKHKAASLGTLGIIGPDGPEYGSLTTPDPISLHKTLDRLAREGITHLSMEASSHGLDQKRLDGVKLSAAGFTNLGRDHLDYHPDIESYFAAKLRLFETLLPENAPAIINLEGARGAEAAVAASFSGHSVMTIGRRGDTIRVEQVVSEAAGQRLSLLYKGKRYQPHLPLIGAFQVENALLAAGFALALGEKPKAVFAALETLSGVPGRLETVGQAQGAPVVVDYAHKPEALEHALNALRPAVSGKLILVFGCGGDRDKGKRPLMGEIASRLADLVIVTDDNPRTEKPDEIRAAILAKCPGAIEIGDRAEAIREAIRHLKAGDALMIAGKGHETGQIIGTDVLPFSDHDVAKAALRVLS